jgi:anti-anti-sigma factor
MNSAGLRSLLDIAKKLRAKSGKLVLAEMPPMIREIYEIAGFRSIIPAYPNLHDARESLGGAK